MTQSPFGSTSPSTSPTSPARSRGSVQDQPIENAPQTYICLWIDCSTSFADPEHLYNHLCNTHIGRKSTNNLCLVCKWKDCGVSCAKRDHITSHLRVHTPLKPHTCEICRKSFKRPQDLKKHEKIHTEEHHAEHKHSKAITVVDSGYLSRVRGEPINPSNRGIKPLTAPNSKYVSTRTKSVSDGSHFGIIPLASSDNHLPVSQQSAYLDDYSSWEGMRSEDTAVSTKRSHGSKVEEFFSDVKKRRVNPAYDGRMVERLNSLAYTQQIAAVDQVHGSSFNPRQVSFDIRTPEELAAVNQFLLTLGRDVTGSNQQRQQQMHAPASGHTGADHFSAPNFFDALNLSQMGLAGMPGMPTPDYSSESTYPASGVGPGYHSAVYPQTQSFERTTHSSVQPMHYGSVYPMMATNSNNGSFPSSAADYPTSTRRESFSGYPGHFHHSPSLDTASPISSASTPSSSTPPRAADSIPDSASATFDYLRPSRGQTPVVHLAPSDHALKPMRSIVPLKSLPTLPRPLNTVLPPAPAPEKLEARRTPAKEQDQPRSLYPLLKLGDSKYKLPPLKSSFSAELPDGPQPSSSSSSAAATPVKLPPLHHMYPSPSLIEGDGSMSSRSDKSTPSQLSSPELRRSPLPRLAELGKDSETDPTVEVPPEQRRHHAELILKLLVSINEDFKKRHGAPAFSSPSPRRPSFGQKLLFEDRLQDADVDVDMAVA